MAQIDRVVRIRNDLLRCMASEFFGTFILLFLAHSTGAAYSLASNGSDGVGKTMATTFGVGLAALIALTVSMPISGGHINPAITVGVATMGHFPWSRVVPYLVAQYLGGLVATLMVYVTFYDSIAAASEGAVGDAALEKTVGLLASAPAAHASVFGTLITSFWGTATFLLGIAAILDQKSSMKPPKWYWPLGVGFVLIIALAPFGANGGAQVNPAGDLASRIAASLLGYGSLVWKHQGGHYWYIAGLVAPHLGAIFGLWSYRVLISAHYPDEEEEQQTSGNQTELDALNKA